MRQSGTVSLRRQPDAERIAIIGAGSVGCMLAAHLAAAGCDITICGRAPLERVVMTIDESTVEHKVEWAAAPAELPPLRYAVLATKIHHTPAVADWLGALPSGCAVLAAQNGVDHRARIGPLTAAAVVPTLVYPNAERIGPGRVRVRRTGRGLVVPDDDAGRAAAALFAGSGVAVETAADFPTAAWEKLLFNVIANPLTALTGRPLEVFDDPAMAALGLDLALEAVEVARAEGAALTPQHACVALAWLQGLPGATPSSMLQDRTAGRRLEHVGLLGPVLALGRHHGVPTPLTRAVLALLDALPDALPDGGLDPHHEVR
ncbi:MAG: 2-dehydropantoate 2-reductase [Actinomycetota bacterium]|nr:2-dehydropantoate 2-reductase [Actinomycetota bacterium]